MTTTTATCSSRGPRIGGEDELPICGRPRGHYGSHVPDREDGWDRSLQWHDDLTPDATELRLAETIYRETNAVSEHLPFASLPENGKQGYLSLVRRIMTAAYDLADREG